MLPGAGALKNAQIDPKAVGRVQAIISSMTPHERRDPSVLNGGRKKRVARGSGTSVQEINSLLKQFMPARKMMKTLGRAAVGGRGRLGAMLPKRARN